MSFPQQESPSFLFRLFRRYFNKLDLISVYFAVVRSRLEYRAPLFLGLSRGDSVRLDKLQTRFHKIICGRLCEKQCLPSLSSRRQILALKFLNKLKRRNHILSHLLPPMSSRGRFLLPKRLTQRRSSTFVLSACKVYNSLYRR